MKILSFACILAFSFINARAENRADKPVLFALDAKTLTVNKSRIKANDPSIINAYKKLIKDADLALKYGPVTVMEKKNNPPSGDKHDYMSLAPYFWPDSSKSDGMPYIRKDGQTNPEVKDYKDKDNMPKLCDNLQVLALAYFFSDDKIYAEHATKLLEVWFLDPATRMNPNLNFAQAIKGTNDGRGAGLIDSRHFIKVVDAIGLLRGSKSWTEKDQNGMKQWFSDFLNWMQTSTNGINEMKTKNNHGAWYDAQRLSLALFVDSIELAKKIVLNAADRLDIQMDDNGNFPAEMARTTSLHYTSFVMNAFFTIAQMSDKTDFDFWDYITPSGKSLKKGFDRLSPYLFKDKSWEGEQIKDFDYEDAYPLLMEAAVHFKCKNCNKIVQNLAGDKGARLRINLLY
jgi:hypothetical protein